MKPWTVYGESHEFFMREWHKKTPDEGFGLEFKNKNRRCDLVFYDVDIERFESMSYRLDSTESAGIDAGFQRDDLGERHLGFFVRLTTKEADKLHAQEKG